MPDSDGNDATRLPNHDPEKTQIGAKVPRPASPAGPGRDPRLLGIVAVYSDLATESDVLPGMLGRTYALHEGEVLYVGKAPRPDEIQLDDGTRFKVTHALLFPFSEEFEYVSRRHLAIEMKGGGEWALMDFSTNGVFCQVRQEHIRRRADQTVAIERLRGRETLVLGIDLRIQRDAKAKERAERHHLQVVPVDGPSLSSDAEETLR
jgi:hypothetical protein